MFLNQLTDVEKKAFISLSIHAANANGVFAEEEREMIQEYYKEMGIDNSREDYVMPLGDIMAIFSESDNRNKRIVMFEILGLVYSDGKYDAEEKHFVGEFAKTIGLSDEEVEEQKKLVIRYLELLKEIVEVVF